MAFSKIILNGTTLMDVTQDTVEESTLLSGETATAADGVQITGTLEVPTPVYQTKTVTPTEQQQVVTADNGTVRIGTVANSDSVKDATTATWTVPITYNTTPAIGDTIVIDAKISVYTGSQSDSIYNVSHTFEWAGSNHSYVAEPSDWSIIVTSDTLSFRYKTVPATINRWTLTILNYTDSTQNGYISKQANYDALSSVTVEAISSTYVGSDIDRNTSSDLTSSGATVTVPAGYYESSASKSIATGLVTVPYNISGASASVSTGTNTLTLTKTISVTPYVTTKGYISSGTAGNASVALTANVTTKDASTITPTTTAQTIASGTYLTGTQTIAAIPSQYIVPSGNVTLSSNGTGIDIAQYATATVDVAGSSVTVEPLNVTANGTYTAPTGTAYSPVTVNVSGGDTPEPEPEPEPTDGKTHIWIHIDEDCPSNRLKFTLRFGQTVANGVRVDWGDNSAIETISGTTVTDHNHTYAAGGDYEIVLDAVSGSAVFSGASNYSIIGSTASTNAYARTRIRKVVLGDDVTAIGTYVFYYCYALTSIVIPDGVTSIGAYAFHSCYSLTSIKIPDGVTSINGSTFYNCYSLTSVSIPDTVASIGGSAFVGCRSLTTITIPDSVTSIGNTAFSGCYALSTFTIPSGVTSIENNTFQNCYVLSSIIIPNTVTSMGNSVFSGCQALQSITIPNTVTSMGSNVFQNCYTLTSITLPENVVSSTWSYAFQNCYGLTSITIPDGNTAIGTSVFYGCSSLTSASIPDSVTSIGNTAFRDCHCLISITIPENVTSIGTSAFQNCYGLGRLRFEPTTPPTVAAATAFTNVPTDCVISVPVGSLAAYTSAANYPSSSTYTYIEE